MKTSVLMQFAQGNRYVVSLVLQLSAGALTVLKVIASHGPISPHVICDKVELSPRTVTLALSTLTENEICRKIPNLSDMRKPLYITNPDRAKGVLAKHGLDTLIRSPPSGMIWKSKLSP